ncbi:Gx transporter family protein, partial [Anaerococcus sp.]|uniref:Gx transporter family protein n=1 Tax=Anaerococcus sp. TaxID=1872515 RepID=UPI00290021B7
MKDTKTVTNIALLTAMALAISIIEYSIPVPVPIPGAKLGFSNMILLLALYIYGFKVAFLVGILKDDGYGIYSQTTEIFLFIYAITCMGAQPAVA